MSKMRATSSSFSYEKYYNEKMREIAVLPLIQATFNLIHQNPYQI